MKPPVRGIRSLQLESLESRTLLAGGALGFSADFELAKEALSGDGPFEASFSLNFGNTLLVLSGQSGDALTIDLDRLPSFVTNLRISSFSTVTFVGTDRVDNLVASNVDALSAPNLSITKSLHLNDVGSVELASAGTIALLKGSNTTLSVRSLDDTMIISDLQSLTIDSESRSLFVLGLNSDQSLYLKYRPDTVSLAGLAANSVHLVDDLVAPDPGATGGGTTPTPAPVPDPVEVITVPLDERTRAFIAELRQLLHGSSPDSQQLLFEFMAGADRASGRLLAAPAGPGFAPVPLSMPPDWEVLARTVGDAQGLTDDNRGLRTFETATLFAADRTLDSFTDQPIGLPAAELPAGFVSAVTLDIDATWPVALAPNQSRDSASPFTPRSSGESRAEEIKFEDTVRAFGSFLVERVAAEYSAGQQSFILLVDPRPSRPAGTNPTSALDLFSRGSRTSLSSLQQVMG